MAALAPSAREDGSQLLLCKPAVQNRSRHSKAHLNGCAGAFGQRGQQPFSKATCGDANQKPRKQGAPGWLRWRVCPERTAVLTSKATCGGTKMSNQSKAHLDGCAGAFGQGGQQSFWEEGAQRLPQLPVKAALECEQSRVEQAGHAPAWAIGGGLQAGVSRSRTCKGHLGRWTEQS